MKKILAVAAIAMVAIGACLLPVAALAQDVATPPAVDSLVVTAPGSPSSQIITELVKLAVAALGILGSYLILTMRKHFEEKAKAEKAAGENATLSTAIARSTFVLEAVVADVNATVRDKLPGYLSDGKIDATEAAELRATAMKHALDALGAAGLAELRLALGISEDGLKTVIGGLIEKAVDAAKGPALASLPAGLGSVVVNAVTAPIQAAVAAKEAAIAESKKAGEKAAGKIVTVDDAIAESLK